jgi:hypothetical protein
MHQVSATAHGTRRAAPLPNARSIPQGRSTGGALFAGRTPIARLRHIERSRNAFQVSRRQRPIATNHGARAHSDRSTSWEGAEKLDGRNRYGLRRVLVVGRRLKTRVTEGLPDEKGGKRLKHTVRSTVDFRLRARLTSERRAVWDDRWALHARIKSRQGAVPSAPSQPRARSRCSRDQFEGVELRKALRSGRAITQRIVPTVAPHRAANVITDAGIGPTKIKIAIQGSKPPTAGATQNSVNFNLCKMRNNGTPTNNVITYAADPVIPT